MIVMRYRYWGKRGVTILQNNMHQCLNIQQYRSDGFKKVADVTQSIKGKWDLINQNTAYLYSPHRSWVYAIVVKDEIVKIGETGLPLGILNIRTKMQPAHGTHTRFGRLARHGNYNSSSKFMKEDTDVRIRKTLVTDVQNGYVSLWAKKCEVNTITVSIHGQTVTLDHTYHKDLEKMYLNHIVESAGILPRLNKSKI